MDQSSVKNTVTITDNRTGVSQDFPIIKVTQGFDGIDGGKLRDTMKLEFNDAGLGSTAHCKSAITYIDGDKGILRHRGYAIEDLAANSSFLETACLLRDGELPSAQKLADFKKEMAKNADVPDYVAQTIKIQPKHADSMAILQTATAAMQSALTDDSAHLMIAKMPTLVAMTIRHKQGKEFVAPDANLPYAENFLKMCFADDNGEFQADPILAATMDRFMILHADHEQNASTADVRVARSTLANKVSCTSVGVAALQGSRHGGANTAVLNMLDEIESVDNIDAYLQRVERKEVDLMGFGHRVYKNHDPRARVFKEVSDLLLKALNVNDPRLEIAKELESRALETEYFQKRKLFPNVDFYSGLSLSAMGFKREDFTAFFALARTVGWVAQMEEFDRDPQNRIARPRQAYVGEVERSYVPMEQRMMGHNSAGAGQALTL
jgi:citrate synthase